MTGAACQQMIEKKNQDLNWGDILSAGPNISINKLGKDSCVSQESTVCVLWKINLRDRLIGGLYFFFII